MAQLDEAIVRRMYLDEGKSIHTIASLLAVAPRTLYDAMIVWRIPRRSPWETRSVHGKLQHSVDEQTLRRLYLDEAKSIRRIAQELAVSSRSVSSALVKWGIPRRRPKSRQPSSARRIAAQTQIDEQVLYQLYVVEHKTLSAIALLVDASLSTVYKKLVRMGVPRRQRGARQF